MASKAKSPAKNIFASYRILPDGDIVHEGEIGRMPFSRSYPTGRSLWTTLACIEEKLGVESNPYLEIPPMGDLDEKQDIFRGEFNEDAQQWGNSLLSRIGRMSFDSRGARMEIAQYGTITAEIGTPLHLSLMTFIQNHRTFERAMSNSPAMEQNQAPDVDQEEHSPREDDYSARNPETMEEESIADDEPRPPQREPDWYVEEEGIIYDEEAEMAQMRSELESTEPRQDPEVETQAAAETEGEPDAQNEVGPNQGQIVGAFIYDTQMSQLAGRSTFSLLTPDGISVPVNTGELNATVLAEMAGNGVITHANCEIADNGTFEVTHLFSANDQRWMDVRPLMEKAPEMEHERDATLAPEANLQQPHEETVLQPVHESSEGIMAPTDADVASPPEPAKPEAEIKADPNNPEESGQRTLTSIQIEEYLANHSEEGGGQVSIDEMAQGMGANIGMIRSEVANMQKNGYRFEFDQDEEKGWMMSITERPVPPLPENLPDDELAKIRQTAEIMQITPEKAYAQSLPKPGVLRLEVPEQAPEVEVDFD